MPAGLRPSHTGLVRPQSHTGTQATPSPQVGHTKPSRKAHTDDALRMMQHWTSTNMHSSPCYQAPMEQRMICWTSSTPRLHSWPIRRQDGVENEQVALDKCKGPHKSLVLTLQPDLLTPIYCSHYRLLHHTLLAESIALPGSYSSAHMSTVSHFGYAARFRVLHTPNPHRH